MRVLIDNGLDGRCPVGPTIIDGWSRALLAAGFQAAWMSEWRSEFAAFDDFRPAAIMQTQDHSRAMSKCLANHPDVVVIDQRRPIPGFDAQLYHPGESTPSLACDLTFVAEWTPEKTPLYRRWLDPIVAAGRWRLKFFGAGDGCPYVQHLGWLDHQLLPGLYASARWCLDVSQAVSERTLQILGMGGACLSTVAWSGGGRLVRSPQDVMAILDSGGIYEPEYREECRGNVLRDHGFAIVLAGLFRDAGLIDEAEQLREVGGRMVDG